MRVSRTYIFSRFAAACAALILALTVSLFGELNARLELVKPETLASSAVYDYLKDFGERFFPFVKNLIIHPNA